MVLLDDVKFAEYYPYCDDSSVIFHAPYTDMEVPLWPMGLHAQDILDFLKGRGVHVINVQSDEKFPIRALAMVAYRYQMCYHPFCV